MSKPILNPCTFARIVHQAKIPRIDIAYHSGTSISGINRMMNDDRVEHFTLLTLMRVAAALGAAPAELWPFLAKRPRSGLLYDRGIFKKQRRTKPTTTEENTP